MKLLLLGWRRNEREFIDRMGGKGLVGVSKARASKRITGTKARRGKPSKRKRGGGCPFDPFSTSKYVYVGTVCTMYKKWGREERPPC